MAPTRPILLLCLALCPSVASSDQTLTIPPEGIIRVISRLGGFGHACPAGGMLLTARHVLMSGSTAGMGTWADHAGHVGWLTVGREDNARDLIVLEAIDPDPLPTFSFKIADSVERGELVWIIGYDFEREQGRDPFAVRLVRAKVLSTEAGHIAYDKSPGPGSSGSCVFNAKGEVVAVNTGHLSSTGVGLGVLVGGFWKMEEPKPEPAVEPSPTPIPTLSAAPNHAR